tara:strand:- start:1375 stop:2073 length:699 start_codon:yes stop_codon:yes gene_type:complete
MKHPKVLVGCPTANFKAYCLDEYIQGVKKLTYPNFDLVIVDNSKDEEYYKRLKSHGINVIKDKFVKKAMKRITHSRNILRDIAIKENYDYFLSLEQDVIPPPEVIQQLLKHNKDVVSAVVYTKFLLGDATERKIRPLMWIENKDGTQTMRFASPEIENKAGLIKIKACGLGCILIKRNVLEKIKFRLNEKENTYDDIPFCADVVSNGFDLFGDANVKCKHIIENMDWDSIDE